MSLFLNQFEEIIIEVKMDKTIREYLNEADNIQNKLDKLSISLKPEELENMLNKLHLGIKNIQAVAKHMANISNTVNQVRLYKQSGNDKIFNLVNFDNKNESNFNEKIKVFPTQNDHVTLRLNEPAEYQMICDDIKIPVKTVKTIHQIPITYLYYVEDIKKYVININGINIKGNLCDIGKYGDENTTPCIYGDKCIKLTNNTCKWYHTPEEYSKHNIQPRTRYFTPGSWLYNKNKNKSKYYTRNVGGLSTIKNDIQLLKKNEYTNELINRQDQLMHDVLIYIILTSKGLMPEYPTWF